MKKILLILIILLLPYNIYSEELIKLKLDNLQSINIVKFKGKKNPVLVVPPPGLNSKILFPSNKQGLLQQLNSEGFQLFVIEWNKLPLVYDNRMLSENLFKVVSWLQENKMTNLIILSYSIGGDITLDMLVNHPDINTKEIFIGVPFDFRYTPKLTSRWKNKIISNNLQLSALEKLGKPFKNSNMNYLELLLLNYPLGIFTRKYFHNQWQEVGVSLLSDWQKWLKTGYLWKNPKDKMKNIKSSSLWIAGEGDNFATHWMVKGGYDFWNGKKKYILIGRVNRYSKEVSHLGLIIGKVAQKEISSDIIEWINNNN